MYHVFPQVGGGHGAVGVIISFVSLCFLLLATKKLRAVV
jgi:hypothetical protein